MAVQCRHLAHLCEVVVVPSDGNEFIHQRVNIAGRGTNKAEFGPHVASMLPIHAAE